MPQAPLLYPTAEPSTSGTPGFNVSPTSDAFGGAVGQALKGMGSDIEGSSDKIWQRAVELQDIQNRTEVDKADAAYMQKAGLIHAQFGSLQGDQAAKAYPQYIKDLQSVREDIKGGLSNPTTQRMFDSTSLSTMGRTVFNGAGYAATQTRVANVDSLTARRDAQIDLASTSDDPAQVEEARRRARDYTTLIHEQKGTTDQASIDQDQKTVNSSLDFNTIRHTAHTDPYAAEKMLDARKSGMTATDYDRASDFVLAQKRSIGSVNIATKVLSDNKDEDGKPVLSMTDLEDKVKVEAGDDPVMQQHAVSALHSLWNQKKYADRQFKQENNDTINNAIQNFPPNVPLTEQALRADPKVAAAIDNLPSQQRLGMAKRVENYVASRDYSYNQKAMTVLDGMRNSDQAAFLDVDPTDPKYRLNQAQQRTIMGQQAQDKKNPKDDARVMRAMQWLRGSMGDTLKAQGVYSMPPASKGEDAQNDYLHFVGSLSSALDIWQQNHAGKVPGPADVQKDIVPTLFQNQYKPGWFGSKFMSDNEPFFKQKAPDDFEKAYKNKFPDAGDAEIQRNYVRMQMQKLYPATNAP